MKSKLYGSARWIRFRLEWLAEYPYCAHCLDEGKYIVANEVHHLYRHNYDPVKFWMVGPGFTESLCKSCHSKETAQGH